MDFALPEFAPGQIVWHKRFRYRGVIVQVDVVFAGSDQWYERVARSRPPKDNPWYHVLVDGADHQTYVAERHLELDTSTAPVDHPMIERHFDELRDGAYRRTRLMN